jgi:two-component system chemotaxis response regulator CheB
MTGGDPALVVVGTSWGGLEALSQLLAGLPATFPLSVAVVQHRGRHASGLLSDLLQPVSPLVVQDVEDKEPIVPSRVYLAPPDYHLLVERGHFSLSVDPPVRYSRPSVDVLFTSASDVYGRSVIGVVLTGANDDGARGLRCIVDRGGMALIQDPATAASPVMPASAQQLVPEAEVLPLEHIPHRLRILGGVHHAQLAQHPERP